MNLPCWTDTNPKFVETLVSQSFTISFPSELFSNIERPATQPLERMHKTFSGAMDPDVKYRPPVIPHSAHITAIPEDDPKLQLYTAGADLKSHSAMEFGKSINTCIFKECSKPSIVSITNLMETMPQPKGKKKKKKKVAAEDDAPGEPAGDGGESPTSPKKKGKKKKKKKAKASDLPEPAKWEAFPAP